MAKTKYNLSRFERINCKIMRPNHRLNLIESALYSFLFLSFLHDVASLLAPLCRQYRFSMATIRKQWLLFDDLKAVMDARSAHKYSKAFKHIKNTCDHPLFRKLVLNGRPKKKQRLDKQNASTKRHLFFVTINDYLISENGVFVKWLIKLYAHFTIQLYQWVKFTWELMCIAEVKRFHAIFGTIFFLFYREILVNVQVSVAIRIWIALKREWNQKKEKKRKNQWKRYQIASYRIFAKLAHFHDYFLWCFHYQLDSLPANHFRCHVCHLVCAFSEFFLPWPVGFETKPSGWRSVV